MTNFAELKRLAEAATQGPWKANRKREICSFSDADDQSFGMLIAHADANSHEDAAFIATANPATILSLIQRVEEAEAALKQQDEDQSEMLTIAHLNGAADLKDWKARALKAESDAAFLNELIATPIAILQERAREEGRLAGIEEAAAVAAQAIRALKEK